MHKVLYFCVCMENGRLQQHCCLNTRGGKVGHAYVPWEIYVHGEFTENWLGGSQRPYAHFSKTILLTQVSFDLSPLPFHLSPSGTS